MNKKLFFTAFLVLLTVFSFSQNDAKTKSQINNLLNEWHQAASDAKFDLYFSYLSDESIYIGTDATENWDKKAFQNFAKPYFDRGRAWNFKTLERNIYLNEQGTIAWFDELLDTQMKICRGSGVLVKEKNQWKIKHYVLSMTVPNENVDEVVKIKAPSEDALIQKSQRKKVD